MSEETTNETTNTTEDVETEAGVGGIVGEKAPATCLLYTSPSPRDRG